MKVFPGVVSATLGCNYSNKLAMEKISKVKPDVVIMAQRFRHEVTDWESISEKIKSFGVKKIIVLGPGPQWKGSLPLIVAKNYTSSSKYIDGKYLDMSIKESNDALISRLEKDKDMTFVDILDRLCDYKGKALECRARVDSNYSLMSMDYGHPTDEGSIFIANSIIKKYLPESLLK